MAEAKSLEDVKTVLLEKFNGLAGNSVTDEQLSALAQAARVITDIERLEHQRRECMILMLIRVILDHKRGL